MMEEAALYESCTDLLCICAFLHGSSSLELFEGLCRRICPKDALSVWFLLSLLSIARSLKDAVGEFLKDS